MKKTVLKRKLIVSHMTIRTLTGPDLVAIAGGMPDTGSIVSTKPKGCSGPSFTC